MLNDNYNSQIRNDYEASKQRRERRIAIMWNLWAQDNIDDAFTTINQIFTWATDIYYQGDIPLPCDFDAYFDVGYNLACSNDERQLFTNYIIDTYSFGRASRAEIRQATLDFVIKQLSKEMDARLTVIQCKQGQEAFNHKNDAINHGIYVNISGEQRKCDSAKYGDIDTMLGDNPPINRTKFDMATGWSRDPVTNRRLIPIIRRPSTSKSLGYPTRKDVESTSINKDEMKMPLQRNPIEDYVKSDEYRSRPRYNINNPPPANFNPFNQGQSFGNQQVNPLFGNNNQGYNPLFNNNFQYQNQGGYGFNTQQNNFFGANQNNQMMNSFGMGNQAQIMNQFKTAMPINPNYGLPPYPTFVCGIDADQDVSPQHLQHMPDLMVIVTKDLRTGNYHVISAGNYRRTYGIEPQLPPKAYAEYLRLFNQNGGNYVNSRLVPHYDENDIPKFKRNDIVVDASSQRGFGNGSQPIPMSVFCQNQQQSNPLFGNNNGFGQQSAYVDLNQYRYGNPTSAVNTSTGSNPLFPNDPNQAMRNAGLVPPDTPITREDIENDRRGASTKVIVAMPSTVEPVVRYNEDRHVIVVDQFDPYSFKYEPCPKEGGKKLDRWRTEIYPKYIFICKALTMMNILSGEDKCGINYVDIINDARYLKFLITFFLRCTKEAYFYDNWGRNHDDFNILKANCAMMNEFDAEKINLAKIDYSLTDPMEVGRKLGYVVDEDTQNQTPNDTKPTSQVDSDDPMMNIERIYQQLCKADRDDQPATEAHASPRVNAIPDNNEEKKEDIEVTVKMTKQSLQELLDEMKRLGMTEDILYRVYRDNPPKTEAEEIAARIVLYRRIVQEKIDNGMDPYTVYDGVDLSNPAEMHRLIRENAAKGVKPETNDIVFADRLPTNKITVIGADQPLPENPVKVNNHIPGTAASDDYVTNITNRFDEMFKAKKAEKEAQLAAAKATENPLDAYNREHAGFIIKEDGIEMADDEDSIFKEDHTDDDPYETVDIDTCARDMTGMCDDEDEDDDVYAPEAEYTPKYRASASEVVEYDVEDEDDDLPVEQPEDHEYTPTEVNRTIQLIDAEKQQYLVNTSKVDVPVPHEPVVRNIEIDDECQLGDKHTEEVKYNSDDLEDNTDWIEIPVRSKDIDDEHPFESFFGTDAQWEAPYTKHETIATSEKHIDDYVESVDEVLRWSVEYDSKSFMGKNPENPRYANLVKFDEVFVYQADATKFRECVDGVAEVFKGENDEVNITPKNVIRAINLIKTYRDEIAGPLSDILVGRYSDAASVTLARKALVEDKKTNEERTAVFYYNASSLDDIIDVCQRAIDDTWCDEKGEYEYALNICLQYSFGAIWNRTDKSNPCLDQINNDEDAVFLLSHRNSTIRVGENGKLSGRSFATKLAQLRKDHKEDESKDSPEYKELEDKLAHTVGLKVERRIMFNNLDLPLTKSQVRRKYVTEYAKRQFLMNAFKHWGVFEVINIAMDYQLHKTDILGFDLDDNVALRASVAPAN